MTQLSLLPPVWLRKNNGIRLQLVHFFARLWLFTEVYKIYRERCIQYRICMSCAINIGTAMFLRNTTMLYVATTHKKYKAAPSICKTPGTSRKIWQNHSDTNIIGKWRTDLHLFCWSRLGPTKISDSKIVWGTNAVSWFGSKRCKYFEMTSPSSHFILRQLHLNIYVLL